METLAFSRVQTSNNTGEEMIHTTLAEIPRSTCIAEHGKKSGICAVCGNKKPFEAAAPQASCETRGQKVRRRPL